MNISKTTPSTTPAVSIAKRTTAADSPAAPEAQDQASKPDTFEISIPLGGARLGAAFEKVKSNMSPANAAIGITGIVGLSTLMGLASTGASYGGSLLGGVAATAAVGVGGAMGYAPAGALLNAGSSLLVGYQISERLGVGVGLAAGLGLAASSAYFTVVNADKNLNSQVGGLIGTGLMAANAGFFMAG